MDSLCGMSSLNSDPSESTIQFRSFQRMTEKRYSSRIKEFEGKGNGMESSRKSGEALRNN